MIETTIANVTPISVVDRFDILPCPCGGHEWDWYRAYSLSNINREGHQTCRRVCRICECILPRHCYDRASRLYQHRRYVLPQIVYLEGHPRHTGNPFIPQTDDPA